MTQDLQDRLIAKALSQPELLTEAEADAIMADPDLRQLLSAAALLKAAAQPAPACDPEAEWQAFRQRMAAPAKPAIKPRRFSAIWSAAAAIALAIGVACAALLHLPSGGENSNTALIDTLLRDTLVLMVYADPAPIVKVDTVSPIPAQPTQYHKYNEAAPEPDLLVIQARVDNEIALVRAEAYRQIAIVTEIDLPDDFPISVPDFQIDGPDLSMLTAQ